MKNYAETNIGNEGRVELHEKLALTGAEISINRLPAGQAFRSSIRTRATKRYAALFPARAKPLSTARKWLSPRATG